MHVPLSLSLSLSPYIYIKCIDNTKNRHTKPNILS